MITTGWPISSSASRKTEIVDVANGVSCSDLTDFPIEIYGAVGTNLDGTPVVCGGSDSSGSSNPVKKCYRFTNGVWEEFASLKERRVYAAGVMYNKKLTVFGGILLKTSENINVDGEVTDGPDLPIAIAEHSMTMIDDTVSFLSGGRANTNF